MRQAALLLTVFAGVLMLGTGCASMGSGGVTVIPGQESQPDAEFKTRSAYIFVNGRQRGITPATIVIKRGFNYGSTNVSLRTGPKFTVLRKYEVEWAVTSSRVMADYTFGNEDRMFDLSDLSTNKDGTYLIPFYSTPIQIDDREFNFTIIVEN